MKLNFISFLRMSSPVGTESRKWIQCKYKNCKKDVNGNIYASTGNSGLKIMIEGHIDEIGGQVLYIDDNGFINFRENGGLDKQALVSQRVMFSNGIEGVIGKKTVHIEKEEDREKIKDIEKLWIDCGFKDKKEALENIEIGEFFTFKQNVVELKNELICSKGIDDKVGAFIAFEVLERLRKDKHFQHTLYAVGTVQEETGGFGARGIAYDIHPDICISLDVEFASDIPEDDKNRLGDIRLGEGLVLKRNTDSNIKLFDYFKNECKKKNLKYQVGATAWDGGGTNACSIKYQRGGIATLDIGIPNRYMHTSSEVISWKDIESGIDMLVEVIKSIPKNIDLIP